MTLPLLWLSLAFMGGIAVASLIHLNALVWGVLVVLGLAVIVLANLLVPSQTLLPLPGRGILLRRGLLLLSLASVIGAILGGLRYQLSLPPASDDQIAFYNDANYDVLVIGTLVNPPDVRDTYANLRLQVDEVDAGDGPVDARGLMLARVDPNLALTYGDLVRLRGRLLTPPSNEDFSYREYLARQGILSYMPTASVTVLPGTGGNPFLRLAYNLKDISLKNVYRLFLDPEASLLAGILLGVDSGLPPRVRQAFNDTGTAHIIAISGFNIAVIAGVLAFIFSRMLGPRRGAVVAAAGILFYAFFVGADPSVVRATIMGLVALLAVQVGRRQAAVNTLAAVSAMMALWNPHILWDVGFQLSVLATLGLILYGGPFTEAVRGLVERRIPASDFRNLVSSLAQLILLTLAAELTTLPIIAYHFKQFSLISPLANAFVLPVQPAVMVLGGMSVIASLLVYPLGQLLAWATWPLTAYTIRLVEFFDGLPHAVVYLGGSSFAVVLLFYAILLSLTVAGSKLKDLWSWLRIRAQSVGMGIAILALFSFALLAWRLLGIAPDGRLHVTFLDVGSADAVYIVGPTGGRLLINGGPSATAASDSLGRRFSPLDHHLDWLVVASTDEQQVAALPSLLPRFPPHAVLLGAPEQASFSSAALIDRLQAMKVPVTSAEVGQTLDLGKGATLKVLDVSSRGLTLLLEWGSFRMLLPIGANLDTLTILENGAAVGRVDVLLLAQSGYAPLTPPLWLENLNPRMVVISVAAADKDGLPSADTLDALEGYSVLRTDRNGWVEVITDGSKMWVSSERRAP